MNKLLNVALGLGLAAGLLPTPAKATPMAYGTGLANPATTIDFSGLSNDTVIGSTYATQGVTFSGLYATSRFGSTLQPTTAPAAANFNSSTTNATFTLTFSSVMSDVAFFLSTDGFGTTITSFLGSTQVEQVSAGAYLQSGADFFGFTNSAFDSISVSVSGDNTAVIDNVELGALATAVPEPGSTSVMLVGLAGAMVLRRRRA